MRRDWGEMAEEYLSESNQLRLCVQLVDARHKPTTLDMQLNEWLVYNEKPYIIVATKADKLSSNQLQKSLAQINNELSGAKVIAYSSQTGKGRDALWNEIIAAVERNS
jgi:GTP-binding protein